MQRAALENEARPNRGGGEYRANSSFVALALKTPDTIL